MRLVVLTPAGGDREGEAALAWARTGGFDPHAVSLGDGEWPVPAEGDVLWCHAGDDVPALGAAARDGLRAWVTQGGALLLSLLATALAPEVGGPDESPILQRPVGWRHADDPLHDPAFHDWPGFPHIRGAQGWGEHPLFDGLQRGTFTWAASEGEPVARSYFRRPQWPAGRVLAVDRAYVRLDSDTAVAWEYRVGAGRILCLGANVCFTAADRRLEAQRDRFVVNAIAMLDPRRTLQTVRSDAWPGCTSVVPEQPDVERATREGAMREGAMREGAMREGAMREGAMREGAMREGAMREAATPEATPRATATRPADLRNAAPLEALPIAMPRRLDPAGATTPAPLELVGAARAGSAYTIAGRRALIVGDEGDGVRECWIHPLCVTEALAPSVLGEPLRCDEVRVSPGAVTRTLRDAAAGRWREVVAASPDEGVMLYEIGPEVRDAGGPSLSGAAPAHTTPAHATSTSAASRAAATPAHAVTLDVTLRLRLQWPHASDALHPLVAELLRQGPRAALTLRGADGQSQVRVGVDGVEQVELLPSPTAPRLRVTAPVGGTLRLAVTATTAGEAVAAGQWRALGDAALADTLARLAVRDRARRAATTAVETPEPQFDEAWDWAKARLGSFVVQVPGVGTGLAAGYAASRPGWGDSRPGYAWFFGRDACWCADALLAAGMFAEARAALEFLAQTADVTGKIVHEVTTSGVAHYDAADSTPLWLRLVATYADWTGDRATVRAHWDQVRAAFAFVLGTDRDGDGLPENTGVGHGWVESGPLGGGAVTSYVASIWIDATRRLAVLADAMGDGELAGRAAAACARAEAALDGRLRDPLTGRLALHLDADGRATSERTALDAVPILLGVDTHASADEAVRALASEDWCAPWGVRMLSRRDARYRSSGYQCGAVWPLFTGWTSLAAYRRGEGAVGWRLLSAVAALGGVRARGAFDEVLDGDSGDGAGICPDQAWSAAMVISPMIYGMLGVAPDALRHRCALDPAWPDTWRAARVTGVRVGGSRLSIAMSRPVGWPAPHAGGDVLELLLESGPPLAVTIGGTDGPAVELRPGVPHTILRPGGHGGRHGRR